MAWGVQTLRPQPWKHLKQRGYMHFKKHFLKLNLFYSALPSIDTEEQAPVQ